MANEITALDRDRSGNLSAVLYYAIPLGIKVAGVVHTPSDTLPMPGVFTQPEKDALDSGDAMFHVIRVGMLDGATPASVLSELRAKYAALETKFKDEYERRYEFAGQRFDKVA